jgi:hypothetical protein
MVARLERESSPGGMRRLLTAAFVLTGLRIPRSASRQLFQGVQYMRESDTYLAILDEGQVKLAKKLIWRWGATRLGAPDEAVKATVDAMTEDDLDRLERMLDHIHTINSWQELLAIP